MTRFLVDESLPPQLAEVLQGLGHDATHVQHAGLAGADDAAIYAAAQVRQAILITLDLDFADVRRFPGEQGVVVIRIRHRITRNELVTLISGLLERFESRSTALATRS